MERLQDHYELEKEVKVTSAWSHCLPQVVGNNWVAAGDAAMSFDPLSSMGISKALRQAPIVAAVVDDYLQKHDRKGLQAFEAAIQTEYAAYLQNRRSYYSMENVGRKLSSGKEGAIHE